METDNKETTEKHIMHKPENMNVDDINIPDVITDPELIEFYTHLEKAKTIAKEKDLPFACVTADYDSGISYLVLSGCEGCLVKLFINLLQSIPLAYHVIGMSLAAFQSVKRFTGNKDQEIIKTAQKQTPKGN